MSKYNKIYDYDNWFSPDSYILPIGELIQVAELSIVPKGEIAKHIQICDELTYAISGKAKIISNNNISDIKGGQIHFLKKGAEHGILADDNEAFRYVCIGINPENECKEINAFNQLLSNEFFLTEDDGNIRKLTGLLLDEFYLKDENFDVMVNAYLTQIFVALSRILAKHGSSKIKKEYTCKTSKLTLYNILRYIDREYISIKCVKQVAEYLSYNEDYVSHLFKKKMGLTIKEYLIAKKMNAAKELLLTSDLRIEEIAEFLNFNSAHSFYQTFKKTVKVSPSEYKKQMTDFRL